MHASIDIFVYPDGLLNVQSVAVYHLFGCRVDAQTLIFLNDFVGLFILIATVYAQSYEHHRHALGQVVEEHFVAEAVVQIDAIVAIVYVTELFHHVEVAFKDTTDVLLKLDELMTHGANGREVVLHGQVYVAGSRESARPAVVSVLVIVATLIVHLFHHAQHHVVMIEREAPARAHVSQHKTILENLNRFLSGAFSLTFRVVCVTFSTQIVHQLRHDGEDRHLPHDGRIPLATHRNVQMPLLIL